MASRKRKVKKLEKKMKDEKSSAFIHGGMASEAEIQQKYFQNGLIYTLQIELTMKCAQGCSYCYAGSTASREEGLTSEAIRRVLDEAAEIKVRCIDWLGGDPLLRPDWFELMEYAQEKKLINNIWTSGLPLRSKTYAQQAIQVTQNGGFISVHLDSLKPAVYGEVHNQAIESNISSILQGVDNLLAFGKSPDEIWNCITLTKPVAKGDVRETMQFFWKEKGIRTVLTLFNPSDGVTNPEMFELTPAEIEQAYAWRDEILYTDGSKSFSTMDVNKFYCASMICLTSEGYYTPCSVIRTQQFGDYQSLSLRRLLAENPGDMLMMQLRDPENLPEPCSSCDQNDVCFGCRATAHHYTGDMFGADPKCPNCLSRKEDLHQTAW